MALMVSMLTGSSGSRDVRRRDLVDRVAPAFRFGFPLIPFQEGLDRTVVAMDASRAVSALVQGDQELTGRVCADLRDVGYVVFQAEFGKRAEFLAIKLDGAAGKVSRAAGVQVDADPLA